MNVSWLDSCRDQTRFLSSDWMLWIRRHAIIFAKRKALPRGIKSSASATWTTSEANRSFWCPRLLARYIAWNSVFLCPHSIHFQVVFLRAWYWNYIHISPIASILYMNCLFLDMQHKTSPSIAIPKWYESMQWWYMYKYVCRNFLRIS